MIELIQGDCLQEMHNIPDGSIDMIFCDSKKEGGIKKKRKRE